jgi:hypothetical protein
MCGYQYLCYAIRTQFRRQASGHRGYDFLTINSGRTHFIASIIYQKCSMKVIGIGHVETGIRRSSTIRAPAVTIRGVLPVMTRKGTLPWANNKNRNGITRDSDTILLLDPAISRHHDQHTVC